jgi:hypothetical protein
MMKGSNFPALSTLRSNFVNSNSSQAQQRAEKLFKKQERAQDARQAMIEYEAHALAVREKTTRLKALRLAKGRLS